MVTPVEDLNEEGAEKRKKKEEEKQRTEYRAMVFCFVLFKAGLPAHIHTDLAQLEKFKKKTDKAGQAQRREVYMES